jgi:uncharacterized protein YfbU (UPF0304 family)
MAGEDTTELRVDVGVLKTQVATLTQLCNKMDTVIDRLMENQTKVANDIYEDMDKKREATVADIKELHSRITTVDRNLSDKIELTERRIMDEIKSLRSDIAEHNEKEDNAIEKILEWKWMAAGGILVLSWLIGHLDFATLGKLLN